MNVGMLLTWELLLPAWSPAKENGRTTEPCSASSQRTGREKAVLLFQRIDRVNDRAPTRLPSSFVKTCKHAQSFRGCHRRDVSIRSYRQQSTVAMFDSLTYRNDCCKDSYCTFMRSKTGLQTHACKHLCSVAAYLLAHSPHILHSLGVSFRTAGCQIHTILSNKACQGLCWLPILPISNLQPQET